MENLHTDVRVQSVKVPLIPLKILGHVNYTAYLNRCSRERNRVPQSHPKFIVVTNGFFQKLTSVIIMRTVLFRITLKGIKRQENQLLTIITW